jgi:hypothetical protein
MKPANRITLVLLLASAIAASGCEGIKGNNTISGLGTTLQGCNAGFQPTSGAYSTPVGINSSQSQITELAQSFELTTGSSATVVSEVALALNAIAPSKQDVGVTLTVQLQSDNNGQPSGSVLASTTMNAAAIKTTGFAFYAFTFPSVTLQPSTVYWIVTSASGGYSSTNYIEWAGAPTGSLGSTIKTLAISSAGGATWSSPSTYSGSSELVFGVGCSN